MASFVQVKTILLGPTPGTSINLTMTGTTVSGNSLILSVSTFNGAASAVTDNKGNTYVKIGTMVESVVTNKTITVWYISGMVGGASHQLTITQPTNTGIEAIAEEWSGLIPTLAFDVEAHATGTALAASSGSTATTSVVNELVWSTMFLYGSDTGFNAYPVTAGSGYSNLNNAGTGGSVVLYSESKVVSSKATQAGTYTIGTGAGISSGPNWAAMVVTFRAPTLQTLAATAVGVSAMSTLKARFLTLAATVTGVASMSKLLMFKRTLAATVTGVTAFGKRISKTLAAAAVAVVTLTPLKRVPAIDVKPRLKTKKTLPPSNKIW